MITSDNLSFLVRSLNIEDQQAIIDLDHPYCLLEEIIFNVGAFARIQFLDAYDTEKQQRAEYLGDLFCETEDLLRLCNELQVFEY